jgi:hypothetical protein
VGATTLPAPVTENAFRRPTVPLLADLAGLDEAAWDAFTRGSALRRSRYDGLVRSVAAALADRSAVVASPEPGATIPPDIGQQLRTNPSPGFAAGAATG